MSDLAAGIVALAVMNVALKALGPALLESGQLSERVAGAIDAMGQGLLASLVVAALVGAAGEGVDAAVLAGVAMALLLRWRHLHELICVGGAIAVVVLVRLSV